MSFLDHSSSFNGASQFTFVTENSQSEARSHAMREYWKQRHRRQQQTKSGHRQVSRAILPRHRPNGQTTNHQDNLTDDFSKWRQNHSNDDKGNDSNVAEQLLSSVSRALFNSRPDPFQTCPVYLTSQHQKLLHHWICTHAAMMFEDLSAMGFNPMRDVWFPLDLSNASSFNCIMAHSAAHLAHLYVGSPPRRGTKSSNALKYKAEAVRILRSWIANSEKELDDDAFAAVIRLLTFERYWGTDKEWKIHRDGLQRMIEARGGVGKICDNWRLQLVVYLVSLMSRPSWLESTNNLEQISQSPVVHQAFLFVDVQKVRCLWLISFIQDMRTFMGYSNDVGLFHFPSLHRAISFLHDSYWLHVETSRPSPDNPGVEYELLACLLSIGIILQDSMSLSYAETPHMPRALRTLQLMDRALKESEEAWSYSTSNLKSILYQTLIGLYDKGRLRVNYVVEMVNIIGMLSLEARQGVEKCLLNLFKSSGETGKFLIDDEWTPDSLLSSLRGH